MNPLLYRCMLPERFSQMGAGSSAMHDGTRLPSHCGYLFLPVVVSGLSPQVQPYAQRHGRALTSCCQAVSTVTAFAQAQCPASALW